MADTPPPQMLFHSRSQVDAHFHVGTATFGPFEVIVNHDQLSSGDIIGYVLGNHEVAFELDPVYEATGPCTLSSVKGTRPEISAVGVLIEKVSYSSGTGVVATFRCQAVTERIPQAGVCAPSERSVSFRMSACPQSLEPGGRVRTNSSGERRVESQDIRLDLGWPYGTTQLSHCYLWDERPVFPRVGHYAGFPALRFNADASADAVSDEDFLATAQQFADDAVLLLSLTARQWVVWYQYTSPFKVLIDTHTRT